jgi:hypothetical protein
VHHILLDKSINVNQCPFLFSFTKVLFYRYILYYFLVYYRSRSRSPYQRRGAGSYRRRSPSPRSPPSRGKDRQRTSKREDYKRRRHSSSNSDRSDHRSPRRDNG